MKDKLARRSRKCVEQLERMSGLVEQQRSEILMLKSRALEAERVSEGRRWQLEEAARHSGQISGFLHDRSRGGGRGGFQQLTNPGQPRKGKLQKLPALAGQKSAPQLLELQY